MCVEDAHTSKKDIVLCCIDFKGVFPSTDHKQLVHTHEFLGLPSDFTLLISNLYSGETTQFITPHGHAQPVGIGRGALQGDPLSPLLFDLMIEPLSVGSTPPIKDTSSHHASSNFSVSGTPMTVDWSPTRWTTHTTRFFPSYNSFVNGQASTSTWTNVRSLLTFTLSSKFKAEGSAMTHSAPDSHTSRSRENPLVPLG